MVIMDIKRGRRVRMRGKSTDTCFGKQSKNELAQMGIKAMVFGLSAPSANPKAMGSILIRANSIFLV